MFKYLLKKWFTPTTEQTLNTFQTKINQLNERIDFCVDEINTADLVIEDLYTKKQKRILEIAQAENAVEQLEKITGDYA